MKKIIIMGFIIFGTVLGFVTVWFHEYTDTLFFLNIPVALLGDVIYGLSIRFFGDPHSYQAHYTIPWFFRIPQLYVTVSILFWGLIGALFAVYLKLRIIVMIIGSYIVIFGGIYLLIKLRWI